MVVEPLGSETHVTATVDEQTIVTVFHDRLDMEPEETIWLQPRTERICLFDTGGRADQQSRRAKPATFMTPMYRRKAVH